MANNTYSPEFSFKTWDIITFFQGRKKLAVAAVGYVLGLLISDSQLVAGLSAGFIEMAFSVGEYYVKRIQK